MRWLKTRRNVLKIRSTRGIDCAWIDLRIVRRMCGEGREHGREQFEKNKQGDSNCGNNALAGDTIIKAPTTTTAKLLRRKGSVQFQHPE